jgi:hypothetical protein
MTASTISSIDQWAAHPIGKAARVAVAVLGAMSAILVLLVATMTNNASWTLILLGVALTAVSIRAALQPSLIRLSTLAAVMVAIPYAGQTL